jgi:AhpD family alkylhydroperoxidase
MNKAQPDIHGLEHCDLHAGSTLPQEALDTPIDCAQCGARVPASAAMGLEGSDYLWHFCGHDCLATWCSHIEHQKDAKPRRASMQQRFDYKRSAPDVYAAMAQLQAAVNKSGLEPALQELIKLRASQINGCAYCIDMHFKDARAAGETEQRLYLLDAWREAPCYSDRERAALGWTEAVTLIHANGVENDVYEKARMHFSERELAHLTLAVITINGWNRLSIACRMPPSYQRSEL